MEEVKVTQSCPTLCDPVDYTVHGILQARILEWVAFPFFKGVFPTQGSNAGLPHCRQILYQLSHQGSPKGTYTSIIQTQKWGQATHKLENNHNCRGSSQGTRGLRPRFSSPVQGLYEEDKLQEYFVLKISKDCIQERQRVIRNRDSTLNGFTQNFTHSMTQHRSSYLKEA